jgi:predicted Rossmann fold flavoprotein
MENNQEKFDVAVIGGGPAGMMAAGRAGELGAKVVLLEKNPSPGKKLLITGKGRCNITQAEFDNKEFVKALGKNGKFLFSSLALFGPEKTVEFFEHRGIRTKTERGGRIFPVSDRAQDVLNSMLKYLQENKVKIITGAKILGFDLKNNHIHSIKLENGQNIVADNFIIATGGKSYPVTGSMGEGYEWAKNFGHKIIETLPALTPIKTQEEWPKSLSGLSLKNVSINIYQNGKKQDSRFGEMLFTHFGISGPIVLDASKNIGELLKKGEVEIQIDLKPALDFPKLDQRLLRDFKENINKDFINYLPELLPQKIIGTIIKLSAIDPRKKINSISKEERKDLVKLLKSLKIKVEDTVGYTQAIVTSGGVNLKEIDSKTMKSKIIDNLSFAGEIIDLDGPTGGYNLQICWSTGFAAGNYAAKST